MLIENRAVRIPSFEYSHCAIKSRLTSKSSFWHQYSSDKADLTPRAPPLCWQVMLLVEDLSHPTTLKKLRLPSVLKNRYTNLSVVVMSLFK